MRVWIDDGMALVSTLLLVALLMAAAVPLAMLARLQVRVSAFDLRRQQAEVLAWSALQVVSSLLPDQDGFAYPSAEGGGGGEGWWLSSEELLPAEQGGFLVRVTDEAGKLPLVRADEDRLGSLPGMDREKAAAILDWLDADDEPRPGGAEIDTYSGRGYKPRNSCPPAVAELVLVEGLTPDIVWGAGPDGYGRDRGEDLDMVGSLGRGLVDWVSTTSVLSGETSGLLDPNQATAAQLLAASGQRLTSVQAQAIISYRNQRGRFQSIAEVGLVPAVGWQGLRSLADVLRPLAAAGNGNVARVNLNTASPTVLAVLPGMDDALLAEIVAAREAGPIKSLGVLWDFASFGPQNAILLDWVAVRGGPLRLQVSAWPEQGKPVVTAEALLLWENRRVQVLSWRSGRLAR